MCIRDRGFVSSPLVQASLGLPFKSEITIRYLPEYNRNRIYFSSYGFGLKHDLTQYFKFFNKIPALSLSAFGAVSFMNINYDIQSTKSFNGSNQAATFDISNYKFQMLSSLNLSIFEIYAGIGISGGKSSFELIGEYELELYTINDNSSEILTIEAIMIPINPIIKKDPQPVRSFLVV